MQEINPCETTIVVNESNKVLVINMRSNWCHNPHITMYQIKRLTTFRVSVRSGRILLLPSLQELQSN